MRSFRASTMAVALAAMAAGRSGRIYGAENIRRHIQQQKRQPSSAGSIATGNRHGGPHQHRREIARNERRAHRLSAAVAI